jgi:alpha-ketoglutarate-dependent taurine dioxygenase
VKEMQAQLVRKTFFEKYLVNLEDVAEVSSQLDEHGLVTFENIESKNQLISISKQLGEVFFHRDSDVDGVTHVVNKGDLDEKIGFKGLTSAGLNLHSDRSGVTNPPELLVFYCNTPASQGGENILVDGKDIYYKLKKEYPGVLSLILKENSVVFGGSDDNVSASIFKFIDTDRLQIRFRYDELGFYSSSIISKMPLFLEIMESCCSSFKLDQNQGYIIKNDRWLHGRTTFSGPREMYRILLSLNSEINDNIKKGFLV